MTFRVNMFFRVMTLLVIIVVGTFLVQATGAQGSGWTSWLDRDNPSGDGDWELKHEFGDQVCANPTGVEARVVGTPTIYTPTGLTPNNLYLFSTSDGLVCRNDDQLVGNCSDYEVRFYCGGSTTLVTVTPVTVTPVTITPVPISVTISCLRGFFHLQYNCSAHVINGSGNYSYDWDNSVQNVISTNENHDKYTLNLSSMCNGPVNPVTVEVKDNTTNQVTSDLHHLDCDIE